MKKKSSNLIGCTECGARLSHNAETCAECGYPLVASLAKSVILLEETDSTQAVIKEYRLLQAVGLIVVAAGILAVIVESRFAAGVALTVGSATYLSGLLGAWWNRHD